MNGTDSNCDFNLLVHLIWARWSSQKVLGLLCRRLWVEHHIWQTVPPEQYFGVRRICVPDYCMIYSSVAPRLQRKQAIGYA